MSRHFIRTDILPTLKKTIAPIARKCIKKNIHYSYEEIGKQFKEVIVGDIKKYVEFTEIELDINPCINGWTVIVQLERQDNGNNLITRCNVPYKKDYDKYITGNIYCEHCNQNRRRKTAYILQNNSGETKIVGSSCLEEFTGGLNASLIAQCFETIKQIDSFECYYNDCNKYSDISNDNFCYDPELILNIAFAVIKKEGGYVKNSCNNSTATYVKEYLLSGDKNLIEGSIYDNSEKSKTYLNWIRDFINEKEEINSYERNLKTVCNSNVISWREIATFCSLIPVYEKNNKEHDVQNCINEYFGEIKQRITINIKDVKSNCFDSVYGSFYIHVLKSDEGYTFIWKTNKSLKRNRVFYMKDNSCIYAEEIPSKLKGTITGFEEYKGLKQTELKRCEVLSTVFINKETKEIIDEKDKNIDYFN